MNRTYFDELRDLYRTDRARLLAFARGLCGDLETAEDALHSAFERLLRTMCRRDARTSTARIYLTGDSAAWPPHVSRSLSAFPAPSPRIRARSR